MRSVPFRAIADASGPTSFLYRASVPRASEKKALLPEQSLEAVFRLVLQLLLPGFRLGGCFLLRRVHLRLRALLRVGLHVLRLLLRGLLRVRGIHAERASQERRA